MPPENKPEQTPGTPPQAPSSSPLKQIRTYQGDIAAALSRQNESLYSIQAKEHAAQGLSTPRSSSVPLFIGGLIFFVLAGVGGWYTYNEFVRKTTPPAPVVPSSRLISAESSAQLDLSKLSRDTFFVSVAQSAEGVKANELRHILLTSGTSTPSTTESFFLTLQTSAPGSLVRALEPNFMLGTLGDSRFIIFKVKSYDNTFGGMLNWEKMVAPDIGPLFATAPYAQSIAPTSVFKDVVYRNKDTRVLYSGDPLATSTIPVIVYSFFDNDTLIITDRLESLQTLIDRLTREKLTR